MDIWSKYQKQGIWGLWCDFSSRHGVEFELGVRADSFAVLFSPANPKILPWNDANTGAMFRWRAQSGLEVGLMGNGVVPPAESDTWQLLLAYESRSLDSSPSFMPFLPPVGGLSAELNDLIFSPPQVLLLNGQPGTGKGAILQALALLHAQAAADLRPDALMRFDTPGEPLYIAPEVAMLEPEAQQTLVKEVKAGARVWTATVYDVQMLKSRKILSSTLVDLLDAARYPLPPVAKRDAGELKNLSGFWQSFHGTEKKHIVANLDFQKRRALGLATLSVESILEEGRGLRGVIAEFEKEAILKAHSRVGRSQHKIARLLKVSRGSLQHKLRKYQLESYASPDADTEESE